MSYLLSQGYQGDGNSQFYKTNSFNKYLTLITVWVYIVSTSKRTRFTYLSYRKTNTTHSWFASFFCRLICATVKKCIETILSRSELVNLIEVLNVQINAIFYWLSFKPSYILETIIKCWIFYIENNMVWKTLIMPSFICNWNDISRENRIRKKYFVQQLLMKIHKKKWIGLGISAAFN